MKTAYLIIIASLLVGCASFPDRLHRDGDARDDFSRSILSGMYFVRFQKIDKDRYRVWASVQNSPSPKTYASLREEIELRAKAVAAGAPYHFESYEEFESKSEGPYIGPQFGFPGTITPGVRAILVVSQ
jgi:hypothetical protein